RNSLTRKEWHLLKPTCLKQATSNKWPTEPPHQLTKRKSHGSPNTHPKASERLDPKQRQAWKRIRAGGLPRDHVQGTADSGQPPSVDLAAAQLQEDRHRAPAAAS